MRTLALMILCITLLFPLHSVEITNAESKEGSATARITLSSDTGSYNAGFSRNEILSWSTSVEPLSQYISRVESNSTNEISIGYAYWKIRSSASCEIHIAKTSDTISTADGSQTIAWTVEVPDKMKGSSTPIVIPTSATVSNDTLVYQMDFNEVMGINVNSLPITVNVTVPSNIISGTFYGILKLYIVTQ